jgi:hypothetical protein
MLANVLKSPTAIQASIQVVRAFIRLKEILATHKELARQLAALEAKHDKQFSVVLWIHRKGNLVLLDLGIGIRSDSQRFPR